MLVMKERWFNYRPILLTFAFLLLGSIFAFYINTNIIFTICITVIVFSLLLILAIYKKKLKYFGIPLTAFVIGVVLLNITIINFSNQITSTPTQIETRITNIGKSYNNYIKVEADNCIFDGIKASEHIYVIIYDNSGLYKNIEIGQNFKFEPTSFKSNDIYNKDSGLPNTTIISNNIRYTAIVNIEDIEFMSVDKTFAEQVKENIKDNLALSLTNENVEIAYSALFGDKTDLNENIYNLFRLSGVAHILAVSGLHVGIIVMALNFLLKPIKHKKWLKFAIISIFLLFYMYLCDFSISVIRASIMAVVLLLSKNLNEEYDIYNSLALAGIVVYAINPVCIFDISFLMSFSCVFGIAMLYKPINIALNKFKFTPKLANALALSMSTTTALIMIMAFFFNNFNIISLFANVIIIPLFTIAFVPIFIISMLSLIIPYITYLLFPLNYLLNFISWVAGVLGNLPISNFTTMKINYLAIIMYFVLIVLLGRLCSAKRQYKFIISLPTLALLFYSLL